MKVVTVNVGRQENINKAGERQSEQTESRAMDEPMTHTARLTW